MQRRGSRQHCTSGASQSYLNGIPNLNYATVVYSLNGLGVIGTHAHLHTHSLNGGALCGVQQGAQGSVSSARQVWEANATRDSDS